MQLTHGHLLGGRRLYAQPRNGYRTGLEPVLLASSVPAQPGQRVLEAGTGAGAGLLCLAARIPALRGAGVEIDPAMADLARRNLHDNAIDAIDIVTGDVTTLGLGPFDHAFANPPWHDPRATASPNRQRQRAKQESGGGLERWIGAISRMLEPRGSLTLILPPALLDRARQSASEGGFGKCDICLLRPKAGRPAKLALLHATAASPQPGAEPAELILHHDDGSFTPEIDAVLRDGAALPWRPGKSGNATAAPATAA